jgi:hypothetical protein
MKTSTALKLVFVLVTFLGTNSLATAKEDHDHTPNVCSAKNKTICAHLGLSETLSSKAPGKFIVDIQPSGEKGEVTNLKVKLWMPEMGHGTTPVKVTPQGNGHYSVTEANFSMAGKWQVQLDFDFAKVAHHLEIPLDIKD